VISSPDNVLSGPSIGRNANPDREVEEQEGHHRADLHLPPRPRLVSARGECRIRQHPGLSIFVGYEVLPRAYRPELTIGQDHRVRAPRHAIARENLSNISPIADKLVPAPAPRAPRRCRLAPNELAGRPDRHGGGGPELYMRIGISGATSISPA